MAFEGKGCPVLSLPCLGRNMRTGVFARTGNLENGAEKGNSIEIESLIRSITTGKFNKGKLLIHSNIENGSFLFWPDKERVSWLVEELRQEHFALSREVCFQQRVHD